MLTHYFQRYHQKENVETANAMLLISRLYAYSHTKFYDFLLDLFEEDKSFEPICDMQVQNINSIPDAVISQPSFKIVIETKLYNQFNIDQLVRHLSSFQNEDYKLLLTLDPNILKPKIKNEIQNYIKQNNLKIKYIHLTFSEYISKIKNILDEIRDYDFLDIVNDYENCCSYNDLLTNSENKMVVRPVGDTIAKNIELNLYYDNAERGYSHCNYLGLYHMKSIQAIGKIICRAIISVKNKASQNLDIHDINIEVEDGIITDEMKKNCILAIKDAFNYNYDLISASHRFFFVDKFYATSFKKITPNPLRGKKIFDLTDILKKNSFSGAEEISNLLNTQTW